MELCVEINIHGSGAMDESGAWSVLKSYEGTQIEMDAPIYPQSIAKTRCHGEGAYKNRARRSRIKRCGDGVNIG